MLKELLARAREARAVEMEGEGGLEAGFTLIELMVVLLIIAILLAIAIPTFLGVTGSAKDRAAQSTLTNVLTETVATYQNSQQYPAIGAAHDVSSYSSADPQFSWKDGTTNTITTSGDNACTVKLAPKCVSVTPVDVATAGDAQGVVIAVMSQTGTCWWAVNLQANPAQSTVGTEATGVPFKSTAVTTAGTFYAKAPNPGSNCYAAYATSGTFAWGDSYANAGSN